MSATIQAPVRIWHRLRERWKVERADRQGLTASPVTGLEVVLWLLAGALGFFAAHGSMTGGAWVFLSTMALVRLTAIQSGRRAFWCGLLFGLLLVVPQVHFFYHLFNLAAVPLWFVLAFWVALFVWAGSYLRKRLPPGWLVLALPVLWTGLEYFRSELYYLRFSWLNAGYALAIQLPAGVLHALGVYGFGFVLMLLAVLVSLLSREARLVAVVGIILVLSLFLREPQAFAKTIHQTQGHRLPVAGVQLEFPTPAEVLRALNQLVVRQPQAELLMLSEYTFDGPVPQAVRDWCRANHRYLLAGTREPAPGGQFYNTATVIGPDGQTAFQQVKAVPIQFFKDGLPALKQQVWESPWGRIGICICYDLSFSRVTDELVRQGAQALIVPTMDVVDWGEAQHQLHARVPPVRAMEYGIPVFRVASSGISELVDREGRVTASAPFNGDGEMLAGEMRLNKPGELPLDRWLAPAASLAVPFLLLFAWLRRKRSELVQEK